MIWHFGLLAPFDTVRATVVPAGFVPAPGLLETTSPLAIFLEATCFTLPGVQWSSARTFFATARGVRCSDGMTQAGGVADG